MRTAALLMEGEKILRDVFEYLAPRRRHGFGIVENRDGAMRADFLAWPQGSGYVLDADRAGAPRRSAPRRRREVRESAPGPVRGRYRDATQSPAADTHS